MALSNRIVTHTRLANDACTTADTRYRSPGATIIPAPPSMTVTDCVFPAVRAVTSTRCEVALAPIGATLLAA